MSDPIVVVGAGIGGLCLGVGLRRQGLPVVVLEKHAGFRAVGAGLAVQLNGLRALDRLGLGQAVEAAGVAQASARIADARGRVLAEASVAQLPESQGRLPVALHRATLHALLLEALGPESLRWGAALEGFEEAEDHVVVRLAGGERLRARVLVGADGLRSAVRAGLRGQEALRYAGHSSWRGVCPRPIGLPEVVHERWGVGLRFGHAPIDGDRVYWYATAQAPVGQQDGPDPKAELLARFGHFASPVPELLAATPGEVLLRTDLFDRPPLASWSQGRVTLLGDAAHPMTPNMGQGACQAMLDAVVLAEALGRHPDHRKAFRAYEAKRLAPANRMVALSWRAGWMAQWAHPWACALRDWAVARAPQGPLLASLREVSRFD